MQQPRLQSSSISFIFFASISTRTILCTNELHYSNCSQQSDCGNIRGINHPFWGLNRADFCSQPGFGIECQNKVPKIKIMTSTFGVLDINSQTMPFLHFVGMDLSIEKKKRPTPGLVIGVVVGGFAGIAAVGLGIIIIITILRVASRRKHTLDKSVVFQNKKVKNERIVEAFVRNFGSFAPKKYSYSDVKRMTKSFSTKIGQGGYGDVYKGTLPDGRLVAVKFLKQSKGNGDEFMNEIASISRTSHVNIVTLLGFCYERKKQALIYEFMPNGSLDKFIYDEEPSSTNRNLEWKTMYQITIGIARGLEYLHRGCNTRIVHFDIKPHNILLDDDFCPKISDFGLAKLCQQKESIISMLGARGTAGYIAPEVFCRTFGEVSHKSDVYSYGMMILEMVGGRKNIDAIVSHTNEIYFPNWIYKRLEPSKDFEYHGVVTEEEKEMAKKIIVVSMWCIQTIPSDRPAMDKVLEMLEGSLESLQVPPKPSLSVPGRSRKHSIPSSSFSTSTSSYKPASQEEEVCIELNDK